MAGNNARSTRAKFHSIARFAHVTPVLPPEGGTRMASVVAHVVVPVFAPSRPLPPPAPMTGDQHLDGDRLPAAPPGPQALHAPVPGDVAVDVLLRARGGDDRAFAQLIEHYDPALRRLTFLLLHDEDRMRKVLSKAYVKAYRALPRYRRTASPGAWLYRIVYQACVDELRRHHRQPMRPGGARSDVPSADGGSAFEQVLDALPADMRALVILTDGDELSHAAAGEVLGLSPDAIPVRLTRARAMLRAALVDDRASSRDLNVEQGAGAAPAGDESEPLHGEGGPEAGDGSDAAAGADVDQPITEGPVGDGEPSMARAPVTHLPAPAEHPDAHPSNGGSRRLAAAPASAPTDREAGAAS